jgi:succinate-acetate transporter protein
LANPAPLGFLGLAVASSSFAALQLGWIGKAQGSSVAIGVFLFTVPVQLLASIVAFRRGEAAPATGMGILAGTWAAVSVTTYVSPPGATSAGLGVLLLGAGASMLVPAGLAYVEPVAAVVMSGAALRFWATAGYEVTGRHGWKELAGWVGIVVAVIGFLGAVALAVRTAREE